MKLVGVGVAERCFISIHMTNAIHVETKTSLVIIRNAKRISKITVLVSAGDIRDEFVKENLKIIDHCKIRKNEKGNFCAMSGYAERDR